jgi:hypothetical protein
LLSVKNRNRRHHKEISATYTAIAIVTSFVVLHLPRIMASTHEVLNTKLIITCIEAGRQYIPPIDFYKMDFIARMLMVVNSAINFLIYCAVSSPFQVGLDILEFLRTIRYDEKFHQICSTFG